MKTLLKAYRVSFLSVSYNNWIETPFYHYDEMEFLFVNTFVFGYSLY